MSDAIDTLRPLFNRIGTDMAVAVNLGAPHMQRHLVELVAALERAYPREMAELRAEHPTKEIA